MRQDMQPSHDSPDELVRQARQLMKQDRPEEGHECLRQYLLYDNALLWLARMTPDPNEALTAAELALKLAPESEVAQRAVVALRETPEKTPEQHEALAKAVFQRTGTTLREARAVLWPFRGIRRPIGEAYDDGTIAIKDLIWAIENANNPIVREASRTVLYHEILGSREEPISPVLNVVVGSRYTERKEVKSLLWTGVLTGLFASVSLLLVAFPVLRFLEELTGWYWLPIALLSLGALLGASLCTRLVEQFSQQAIQYRIGRRGEEEVANIFRQCLDGRWTLFRNLALPGRKSGDIDLLLVGPGGVWVFETKTYSGEIRNVGDRWKKKGRFGWYPLSKNPGRQARRSAVRVREYLDSKGVRLGWVPAAVVWAGGLVDIEDKESILHVNNPQTRVWHWEQIDQHIDELWQTDRSLSEEEVANIEEIFQQVADEAKRSA